MTESIIILLLIIINGVFSMAEIAIVSSNKIKLENEANEGDEKAKRALELANSPNRFLSTVQVCITLIGIVSGVFGGAALSDDLKIELNKIPDIAPYSETISYLIIIFIITFISLVVGELVPKRIGLLYSETIAKNLSGFMKALSSFGSPIIWILSKSTEFLLRLFGIKKESEKLITVSEEEITAMIEKGTESGTFEEVEQDIVERLFFLSDRNVGSLMTNKTDIILLDIQEEDEIIKSLTEHQFINYPVYENEIDNIIGILNSKKVLSKVLAGGKMDYRSMLTPPLFVHDKLDALKLLEQFKKSNAEFAIVVDEFGTFSGVVTLKDLFEALVGEVTTTHDNSAEIVQRDDKSWLVDGLISFDEFLRYFDLSEENIHKENDFHTLSGFVMYITRHIPKTGEKFDWKDYLFEVIDMDGLRVDKVLVTKLEEGDKKEE